MPTVTFGTGQKVTFDQTPSSQDIQEVASKMGIDNPGQSQPSGIGKGIADAAKGFATNMASGPLAMAARPGQLLGVGIAGAASKLTGNPSYYQNALNAADKPSSFAGIPLKPIGQETPESIAGEGLSTVSLGAPGSGALGAPAAGALTGAIAGAGSSMQNNASPANVATNAAVGGLLGYGTGALTQGVLNRINAPKTLQDYLVSSGASDPAQAGPLSDILNQNGISDLSSKDNIVFAKNTLANQIGQANSYLTSSGVPDPISGEISPEAARWTSRVNDLKTALNAVTRTGKYVDAITPNLLRHGLVGATSALTGAGLLTNAIPNAASYLKDRFVGQLPNFGGQ